MAQVWDGSRASSNAVLTNADQTLGTTGQNNRFGNALGANFFTSPDKIYAEVRFEDSATFDIDGTRTGVANELEDFNNSPGSTVNSWAVRAQDGAFLHNAVVTPSSLGAFAQDDVLMIALDLGTGQLWFGRNGTWSGDPTGGTGEAYTVSGSTFYGFGRGYESEKVTIIQEADWNYTPPPGFGGTPYQIVGYSEFVIELGPGTLLLAPPPSTGEVNFEISIEGRMYQGDVLTGSPEIPQLTATGLAYVGTVMSGAPTLAPITGVGYTPGEGAPILEPVTGEGTILPGAVMSASLTLPRITVLASGDAVTLLSGDNILPVIQGSGSGFAGSLFTGAPTLARIQGTGTLFTVGVLAGTPVLAPVTADGFLAAGSLMSAALQIAPITVRASTLATLLNQAWSMNSKNLGVGAYPAFPFFAVVELYGKLYGASATGLYLLEGADDDGTAIPAEFLTGISDFGSDYLKRAGDLYLSQESEGGLQLVIGVDGGTTYAYPVDRDLHTAGQRGARGTIARGLRSRHWQIGAKNTAGEDFRVDTMSLVTAATRRKS